MILLERYDVPLDSVFGVCIVFLILKYYLRSHSKDPNYHLWFECPQAHLTRNAITVETDIAKVLQESGNDIVILYGSQSGTSQRLAQNLSQAIDRRFSRPALIASLSDYSSSSIAGIDRKVLVLFILSTYGEGDPPDNAADFSEWLGSNLPECALAGLRFAMLGVGSSNYKWYNQFSRISFNLLRSAGATPLLDLHLADDAQGLVDEGYFNWITELFRVMVDDCGIAEQPKAFQPSLETQFTGDFLDEEGQHVPIPEVQLHSKRSKADLSPIRPLPIVSSRLLTDSADRPFVHMDVNISNYPELKYTTGDHISVWPENEDSEVDSLRQRLGISSQDARRRLMISKARPAAVWNSAWEGPVSLRLLLKRNLEIAAPISREFIQDLKEFAPSEPAKAFLQSVSASVDRYMEYRASKRITLASVLQDASPNEPWSIPVSFILERVASLKPRYYSISSSASVHPRRVSMTVSVTTLQLKNAGQVVNGLASHYLSAMAQGQEQNLFKQSVFCQIRKSKFRLPAVLSRPIVMIATGSGIAPFRGFIQHAVKQAKLGHEIKQLVLFFGCRGPEEHLYREEMEAAAESLQGKLKLVTAYSRFGESRCYVQDKIRREQGLVGKSVLGEGGSLYICGSTAMARGVSTALKETLCELQKWSEAEYARFEADTKRARRWQEDVWG